MNKLQVAYILLHFKTIMWHMSVPELMFNEYQMCEHGKYHILIVIALQL